MESERGSANIVVVGYRSTSYYLVESSGGRWLLVDCGWPGTFGLMRHELRRKGIAPSDIAHILITHYHPDHAGLVEEMKALGARLLLVDVQAPHVAKLEDCVKPADGYTAIRIDDAITVGAAASRAFLHGIGFEGEIVATPGHSDDSVSLVLDEGLAFVGDLQPERQLADDDEVSRTSWQRLRALGVRRIYPAHGGPWFLDGPAVGPSGASPVGPAAARG